MGPVVPFTLRLKPFRLAAYPPKKLLPNTVPLMPVAMPVPITVARPQGTKPGWKLAAFTKPEVVTPGPGEREVRLADALKGLSLPEITLAPAWAPAVTMVETT